MREKIEALMAEIAALSCKSEQEIAACWQEDVAKFKEQRRPYLLYAE